MTSLAGKGVSLTFRNFPLSQHANAQVAATAAEAAGDQGKYWQMHDLLYANQASWTADPPASQSYSSAKDLIYGYATQLGLDMTKFKDKVESRAYNTKISRDMADGNALGVNATPTFYVNGTKLADFTTLPSAIATALSK